MKYTVYSLKKRLLAMMIAVTFLFFLLFGRLFYVQIISGMQLQSKALSQWTRDLPIVPARGEIVDRNGELLAGNKLVYSVYVRPKAVTDADAVVELLAGLFDLDREKLRAKVTNRGVSEITVQRQVEKEQAQTIMESGLNGIYLSEDNERIYPNGNFLSQVLGYVSSDSVGQAGLEAYYHDYLKGIEGKILTQADLQGVEISNSSVTYLPAIDGFRLGLTIDATIQKIAENAMEQAYLIHKPKGARVLIMDPKTGAILAMVNKPSLDLNDLPRDALATTSMSRARLSKSSRPPPTWRNITRAIKRLFRPITSFQTVPESVSTTARQSRVGMGISTASTATRRFPMRLTTAAIRSLSI